MKVTRIIGVLALALIAGVVFAQGIPQLINYHGRLTDDTGLPLDGPVEMGFRLLDADTISASVLWSETHASVQVNNGIYHIMLGSVNPIPPSAMSQADIFLEVIVAGEVLRPRSQVTSVAFAHKAASVPDGSIGENQLADNAVTSAKILDGEMTSSDVGFNYAGSSSKGGAANDLSCTDCVSSAEVQFNYAGSSSKGGMAFDSDMLDGQHGFYYQDAGNINAGNLGNGYFSAYSDLTDEGYLNEDSGTDILTMDQSDARFVNQWETWDSNMTVTGDLTVSGGNIGIGTSPSSSYGIRNDQATAPSYGAYLYGSSQGVRGALSSDPNDHYAYLGSDLYGVYARSGNSDEATQRYGGNFNAFSQSAAYGVYGAGYSNGGSTAYGVSGYGVNLSSGPAIGGHFTTNSTGTGTHTGVYGEAQSDLYSTKGIEGRAYTFGGTSQTAYGVMGQVWNATDGPSYGGYFYTLSTGTGERYGVYADCDGNSAAPNYGVYGTAANIGSDVYGGYFEAENTGGAGTKYGVYGKGVGYGVYGEASSVGVYGTGSYGVQGRSSNYGGRFEHLSDPSKYYVNLGGLYYGVDAMAGDSVTAGNKYGGNFTAYSPNSSYGVYGSAYGYNFDPAYGVRGYGSNSGSGPAYGGYFSTDAAGAGIHYGIYASADEYAAWFEDGLVHIGDDLAVYGLAYFSGGIDAPDAIDFSDVSFNFAGSASKGGAASNLDCTDCVTSTEVAFSYAGSASKGGPAADLSCTDCLNETEIEDIYLLNTTDTLSGNLAVIGGLWVSGAFSDSGSDAGTPGQILSTTGSGTNWIDPPSGGDYYTKAEVDALLAAMQAQIDANTANISTNASDIDAIEATLAPVTYDGGTDFIFTGVNVHVRSGTGMTNGGTNGLGNLVVGYNENIGSYARSGSHNIIVGKDHGYTSYGGIVTGYRNRILAPYSNISGGSLNIASGDYSSISGGYENTASGGNSSVSGGWSNRALGEASSINGGADCTADEFCSSISGGASRSVSGSYDWRAGALFEDY